MPDKLMRAQVIIGMDGGLPEDYPTNTLYFDGDEGFSDGDYWSGVMTLLEDFYHGFDDTLYPTQIDGTATVKIYDMRDPTPRIPEFTDTITLTPSANGMYPGEVAIVCSFQAEYVSGVPNARRRGRIYLGPVQEGVHTITGSQNRPDSGLLTAIANAAATMENGFALSGGAELKWAVYSPTTDATASIDDAFNDVIGGWVDNAWDTQRRRGPAATGRTTWT